MTRRPRTTVKALMGVAALATVLSAAACGGSSAATAGKTPGKAPASPGGNGQGGDRTAFNECLKQQGVTPPTGRAFGGGTGRPSGPPPSGRPQGQRPSMSPEMQKAYEACSSKLPQGGRGRNFDASALQAFNACMKTNGAAVPAQGGVRNLKTSDPKVAKALQKCRPLLPTASPSATP